MAYQKVMLKEQKEQVNATNSKVTFKEWILDFIKTLFKSKIKCL